MCNNTHAGVIHDPPLTFWTYLTVRTAMGVLTAASLMMFEGAVMATVQEMGGDYGIQRFVGNFGAIVFAPLGGYVIDSLGYEAAIYIYLVLKLIAALLILLIKLDFKPPGELCSRPVCRHHPLRVTFCHFQENEFSATWAKWPKTPRLWPF